MTSGLRLNSFAIVLLGTNHNIQILFSHYFLSTNACAGIQAIDLRIKSQLCYYLALGHNYYIQIHDHFLAIFFLAVPMLGFKPCTLGLKVNYSTTLLPAYNHYKEKHFSQIILCLPLKVARYKPWTSLF